MSGVWGWLAPVAKLFSGKPDVVTTAVGKASAGTDLAPAASKALSDKDPAPNDGVLPEQGRAVPAGSPSRAAPVFSVSEAALASLQAEFDRSASADDGPRPKHFNEGDLEAEDATILSAVDLLLKREGGVGISEEESLAVQQVRCAQCSH